MADGNISSIQLPDGGIYNVKDNTSGFITGMTILSYGTSTWNDFITAYNANKVVYCRASSNSNPASGTQTRLAFMAYVNNEVNPTEVEFQYYRSVNSHSDSQQGDQVFVYKITSAGTWTVTIRNAFTKIVAGGDLTGTYADGTLTISANIPTIPTNVSAFTNDAGYLTSEVNSNWVNGSQTGSVRTIHSEVENSNYTIGQYAVAEGAGTKASGVMSHAEGASTIASGGYSHAEGGGATASGNYSHAEGLGSTASGQSSHAEGGTTVASGQSAHAEGGGTTANGNYSHAEGVSTIANHRSQHVFGEWNITDSSSNIATEQGNYVEIVGNGTSSTRSNARTLDWLGNEVLAGKLTIGANPTAAMDVVTKQYMENQGYLTSYTETDPVFSVSAAAGITSTDISNWNGKSSTDEKVKATALTFDDYRYYPIFGHDSNNAETKNYTNAFSIGASSTYNCLTLNLGNTSITSKLRLYKGDGNSNRTTDIIANLATGGRTITLPDASGTVALTSDIPDAVSITRKTTTGTNIADITIGNTTTQLYAPSSGTQVQLVRW